MPRSAVCFVPHEFRCAVTRRRRRDHTGDGDSAQRANRQLPPGWIVDPLSPVSARSAAALWWIPAWLAMIVEVAARTAAADALEGFGAAPFREFAHARASTADG